MSVFHQLTSSIPNFSYQRLKQENFDDEDVGDHLLNLNQDQERVFQRVIALRSRNWYRFRRVHTRKRFRVKVPSLRRFIRRKVRMVRLSCANILKRLKQSQAHFGEIFAGNYLFLQVNPASLKCIQKAWENHHHELRLQVKKY